MLTFKSYIDDHFNHHLVVGGIFFQTRLKVNSIHLTAQIRECLHDIKQSETQLLESQVICMAREGEKQSNVHFIFTNFLTVHTRNPCLAHLSVASIIFSITSH